MVNTDLNETEFNSYYARYIDKLSETVTLRKGFEVGKTSVLRFFTSIAKDKLEYRYAPEKWSIKEVLQHLIDTERIFMYRCFRIARNDKTDLAGFDQEIYIDPSAANSKSLVELLNEFEAVRNSSISLLNSLSDTNLKYVGNASDDAMSARAAAFTVIGHEIWHMNIIKERYL